MILNHGGEERVLLGSGTEVVERLVPRHGCQFEVVLCGVGREEHVHVERVVVGAELTGVVGPIGQRGADDVGVGHHRRDVLVGVQELLQQERGCLRGVPGRVVVPIIAAGLVVDLQ